MKIQNIILVFSLLFLFACSNEYDYLEQVPKVSTEKNIYQKGVATWYGPGFDGRRTSSGEPYDMYAFTAAHLTMPLQTIIRVKNTKNDRVVILRVNDRGPVNQSLILDLSKIAANNLDIPRKGSGSIEIEILGEANINPLKKMFDVYRNLGNEEISR
ncbi:MAG: septal ring lytic transglycosylase RlpA family protein [Bacteroidales bacterium]|nr:septal ring lytic transglycosylase RlpA family protein [Bacteroidales bacterium]